MLVFNLRAKTMKSTLKFCTNCGAPLEDDGRCLMCPAGNPRTRQTTTDKIDRTCPWNEHGNTCGKPGSLSDTTLGNGPWYCPDHYWQLKGYRAQTPTTKPYQSYRQRWFQERNLPFKPAKLPDEALATWTSLHGFMPHEPSQDDNT